MKKMNIGKFALLCFVLIAIFSIGMFFTSFKTDYLQIVKQECLQYDLDENLVLAIIKSESKFNKNAVSKAGAVGLMQILPSTADWIAEKLNILNFNLEQLKDANINIKFGCYYLNYLKINYFDDENLIICSYNAGPNAVMNWLNNKEYSSDGKTLKVIPFEETKTYLNKVKFNKKIYDLFILNK